MSYHVSKFLKMFMIISYAKIHLYTVYEMYLNDICGTFYFHNTHVLLNTVPLKYIARM